VKAACPPIAAPVRVRAELEQDVHHRCILRVRDDRGRVEAEDRIVDAGAQLRVLFEQASHGLRIVAMECLAHLLFGRALVDVGMVGNWAIGFG